MKRRIFGILCLLVLLVIAAQTAIPVLAAPPHMYENYNVNDDSSNNVYGVNWYAQTFTPSVAHTITSVKLKLYRVGTTPGNVTVSIRATSGGHPILPDLCSGTINGNSLTTNTSGNWYEITFTSGYNLSASTMYAIVVRATGGTFSNYIGWRRSTSAGYAGGCREDSGTSGADGTWTSHTTRDMMFEEWGDRAPVLSAIGNKSVNESQLLTFNISATDPDGDSLTYSASNLPSGASFNATTQTFSWTPSYTQAGNYTGVHFEVTDGNLTASENITITVINVNRPPVANNQTGLSVGACKTLTVTLNGTDPDGDPLTYKISTLPAHGDLYDGTGTGGTHITSVNYTVTDVNHKVTYQPNGSYSGADSFGFKVNDGALDSAEATISIAVTKPTASASSNSPVCEGSTITLTGGPGGMTSYNWTGPNGFSNSLQSPTVTTNATFAMAGNYTLTVTDSNGCTASNTTSVVVNARPAATASSNSPVCEGSTITLTGGPGGMTSYNWTGPNGFSSNSQSPTVTTNATLAMAGTYTLTITNSNGCTASNTTSVVVNARPAATASSNSPVCEGSTITLTGGPGGMTSYNWTGPNGFSSNSQSPTVTTNATLAMAGTYTLTITNSNGCTASNTTSVVVNARPTCSISADPGITVCAGNNVTLTEDGGNATSWLWTTAETTKSITVSDSGTYGVTITDANGCQSYCEIEITVNALPDCHISADPGITVCAGNNVTLTEDGGNATSWLWTTAETTKSITVSTSGTYGVTVTDSNGCQSYCEIKITVNPLPACSISADPGTTVCAGTDVTLNETGGDAESWLWTTAETTKSITVSTTGTYGVTITDANGCTSYCEIEITVNALPDCHISADPGITVCAGNNVTLTEDGGNATSWLWTTAETTKSITVSDSGTYGVTITDANGCTSYCEIEITVNALPACHISADPGIKVCAGNNVTLNETGGDAESWLWTTAETTQSITVSTSGTYGVTVTDSNGCQSYCEIKITVNPLPACSISADPGTTVCAGTDVTLNETGGDAESWLWTTAETTQSITVSTSGTYGVTVTDSNGCQSYCEIKITVNPLPACSISADPGTTVCAGTDVTLNETGGDAESWLWTTAETTQSITVSTSGTYGVTVTDSNGCQSYCEIKITVNPLPACSISADPGTTVCAGTDVTLNETGGDAESWLWTTAETTQSITVSTSGTYGVTVTDSNGCQSYCEIKITVNPLPACSISADPGTTVCAGTDVTLNETGGDAESWLWTTAETTQSITVSTSGTYGVTVTDSNGCQSYCEIKITVNPLPACSISADPGTTVCAGTDVTLNETGGDAESWLWTTAETTQSITVSTSGTYGVTVTDSNGCQSYCEIKITVNPLPACSISADPGTTVCAGTDVTLNETGGDAESWLWTTAETTQSITVSTSGTYGVTVTDSNGCQSYCEIKITVLPLPEAAFHASDTNPYATVEINFYDDSTGTYDSWFWDFGDGSNSTAQNPSHAYSSAGNYTVSLTISDSCGNDTETKIDYINVWPHDILDYYRGLHAPYDKVDTLDLLTAADDWSAYVAPPGFDQPITTLQLLQLADEWMAGG